MAQRITVMLDDEVVKKLRSKQAKKIKETANAISFSAIINDSLKECVK
ncbi:MAG: hypothetical protein K5790_07660 [Nitrosopumilus sp.]|nr:hypothetical protein [Nitrosopumilus sp.]MCV0393144.1 hypothetical protein [Nitrosopumilus sp.]